MRGESGWVGRARGLLCALVGAAAWFGAAAEVRASGEHKVPDLRQEGGAKARRAAVRLRIPLTLHIASEGSRLAFDSRRLERSLVKTNAALAQYGIEVYVARVAVMPDGYAGIKKRRDRRRLAEFAPADGTIHVFLVQTVELGGLLRGDRSVRGLHWRYRGLRRKLRHREFLVVGGDAPSTTLVHELGHLFGLEHADGRQNLMCSCREGPRQIFTRAQGQQIRRGALAFLERTRGAL
jgi:hypothetical protein